MAVQHRLRCIPTHGIFLSVSQSRDKTSTWSHRGHCREWYVHVIPCSYHQIRRLRFNTGVMTGTSARDNQPGH